MLSQILIMIAVCCYLFTTQSFHVTHKLQRWSPLKSPKTSLLSMVATQPSITSIVDSSLMRDRIISPWDQVKFDIEKNFGINAKKLNEYDQLNTSEILDAYESMQMARQFENACSQAYMQGHIRGFMHLDNGQETLSALVADSIKKGDIKYDYYREHAHAIASGVSPNKIMAELFMKVDGTCKGAGGSMHIFDVEHNFQGGWALVSEQLPYAVGAARSIKLDRHLYPEKFQNDDRITIVFIGDGGAQNGRMAECLNAAAKENLPILFIVVDNGRAINTFTPDVAQNSDVYLQGLHYGVPGVKVDGQNMLDVVRSGRAVVDYVRENGPAILQVHTFRFTGHSPADPEHERGRKEEKKWARNEADPIKIFEAYAVEKGLASQSQLDERKAKVSQQVKDSIDFALKSEYPSSTLAKELEYPDPPSTDYNKRDVPPNFAALSDRLYVSNEAKSNLHKHIDNLRNFAKAGTITIGDAVNLAILEEMVRDPTTTIHAEDLQAGSSYNIPKLTQQSFGTLRAADEIIDEGHFIGKALGEGMNGYRPIVELMNANFGIYGMAELSSVGNAYSTSGGQYKMPMTVIGAGGTAPNQSLGPQHSQPFHAYVMGIPGLKICTAASPGAAYGLTKSMIRDNGPGMLFLPVKMMKESKGTVELDVCAPLNKAVYLNRASDDAVKANKAVTVLTYLHGVKEAMTSLEAIKAKDPSIEVDLIELRSLKPLDMETIRESLKRTHKLIILDESTHSGGVGATISAAVSEQCYYDLDMPIRRLCMDDSPVPYASSMEVAVVKRAADLTEAAFDLIAYKF